MFTRSASITLRPRRARHGFTLLEAALATMIVGIGLVAMLQLIAAGTAANLDGAAITTGVNFAKSLRELTLKQTFDEVRTLDGQSHSPPVDSRGIPVSGFDDWRQTIRVQTVDQDRLTTDVTSATPQGVRVTVAVMHNGRNVCAVSWYRFKAIP